MKKKKIKSDFDLSLYLAVDSQDKRYGSIYAGMLRSAAYRALSHNARLLLITAIVHCSTTDNYICLHKYCDHNDIDYNAFPWPILYPTPWLKDGNPHLRAIEKTAQAILDARSNYPNATLAELYKPLNIPFDLLKAHEANDKAVMQAYELPKNATEAEIVAYLMNLYKELINKQEEKDE